MKKKLEEEKNNNENKRIEKNDPIPYQEMLAEPSEKENEGNDDSQIVDEDGNIFNLEQLTPEEKMAFIQQQLILQKLQEEAEARGEHFDPQEYIDFLEEQAGEEELREQELGERERSSNKLNKSF